MDPALAGSNPNQDAHRMARAAQQYHDQKTLAMARYIAKKEIVEEIRRQGGQVAHYAAKELIERADAFIREHRAEVVREVVMRRWERWFEPMRLEEKGSAKMAFIKSHGMGFFKALFAASRDDVGGEGGRGVG